MTRSKQTIKRKHMSIGYLESVVFLIFLKKASSTDRNVKLKSRRIPKKKQLLITSFIVRLTKERLFSPLQFPEKKTLNEAFHFSFLRFSS